MLYILEVRTVKFLGELSEHSSYHLHTTNYETIIALGLDGDGNNVYEFPGFYYEDSNFLFVEGEELPYIYKTLDSETGRELRPWEGAQWAL